VSKLEEVSHEMLVLVLPRVSSRVSGFLWLSFSKVSTQVVMAFCVAGVAFCDIPTCLITRRNCQNWRKSARNARFSAPTCLVSSLWFSCGVAVSMGEAPHSTLYTLHSALHNLHFSPHSTLYTLHSTLCTLHFTLLTPHSRLYAPHSTLYTPHSSLYTLLSTLYTLHSTLHT